MPNPSGILRTAQAAPYAAASGTSARRHGTPNRRSIARLSTGFMRTPLPTATSPPTLARSKGAASSFNFELVRRRSSG